jgi:biopolymer transport protein ExbB/TolQ
MEHVINYISTYLIASAILGTYLVGWYKEFSKLKEQLKTSNDIKTAMNILESSYQNAANYIKEALELLLKDFDNERKFLEMIGLKSILKEEEINDQNREYVIKEANEVRKAIEKVLEALSKGSYKDKNMD